MDEFEVVNRSISTPRRSDLPIGYFDRPWWKKEPDFWVVVAVVLCGIVALIVSN